MSFGLTVGEQAEAVIRRSLLERNYWLGAYLADSNTTVTVEDSVVRNTLPVPIHDMGYGIVADAGAKVVLHRILLDSNGELGLFALSGSNLEVTDSAVNGTVAVSDLDSGIGAFISGEAVSTFTNTLFARNERLGLAAITGSEVNIDGCAVLDIDPDYDNAPQAAVGGLLFLSGATFSVSRTLVERTNAVGIAAVGSGTSGTIEKVAVRTTSQRKGAVAFGVFSADGAGIAMTDSLVETTEGNGIGTGGAEAQLLLDRCVVRDTRSVVEEKGRNVGGHGVIVFNGGSLLASGLAVEESERIGMVGVTGATFEIGGSIVADTRMAVEGLDGHGVVVLESVVGAFVRCWFRGNSTVGVAAYGQGTSLTLAECVVADTMEGGARLDDSEGIGEFQVFGDGVLAAGEATIHLDRTIISDNERTGAYYFSAGGQVEGSVVTRNNSFGLAMEQCRDSVVYNGQGNHIFGNAANLPPSQSAQVTTSPQGLPVPPPPDIGLFEE